MSASNDKYKENLKNAAEFLIKGGTLLSDQCKTCNGIQVKKNNEIICVICGKITVIETIKTKKGNERSIDKVDFEISKKIKNRVTELIISIGSDKNLVEEEQRLRVIDNYIKILEKIKDLD